MQYFEFEKVVFDWKLVVLLETEINRMEFQHTNHIYLDFVWILKIANESSSKKKTKKLDTSEIKKIQIPKRDASFIFNDLIYTIYLLHTKMLNLC